MNNQKLSLAELKAKAANTNQNEVLEKVQGGKWSDCHGLSGAVGKFVRGERGDITWPADQTFQ